MPAIDYGAFISANKPFATLGEIAAQKDERAVRELQTQVTQSQLRRLEDEHQKEVAAQQSQQRLSQLAQKHSQGGVLDQEALLKDLQSSGDMDGYRAASDAFSKAHSAYLAKQKADRDEDRDKGLFISQQLRDVTPDLYPRRRAEIVSRHPDLAPDLPPTWDETTVKHLVMAPLTHAEYVSTLDKLEAKAEGNYGKVLVNLALAETPEQIQKAFADSVSLGIPSRLTNEGLTPESVSQMTPEQRRQLLLHVPGLTPNAILEATKPKAQQAAGTVNAGSFEDYVLRYATEKGKTPEQVTTTEIRQLRKEYQQADDKPAAAGAASSSTRNVTSGDANRLSEIQDSLNDLKALRETLLTTKNATGTSAKVGAMMPNFVTNATGWGVEAKQRQGTIDRVKQVIGKALEGGVLRKEDEIKYEKILPTIYDSEAVAESKLNGLEQAISKKWDTHLGSLEDAGYNTSRYRARPVGGATAAPAGTTTATPKFRFNPATGKVEPIQ